MEGSLVLSYSLSSSSSSSSHKYVKFQFNLGLQNRSSPLHPWSTVGKCRFFAPKNLANGNNSLRQSCVSVFCSGSSLRASTFALEEEALGKTEESMSTMSPREMLPKIDKSGRFCSPRAARELALSIVYAACLEGSDPVRLFEKRINGRREPGLEFNKATLLEYNHMSFGGPPITVESVEEENEILRNNEKESAIEAEVLAAPPKLVYSKLILRFTRKLLVAVVDKWDSHVLVINKVAPPNWKDEPAGRILELCILHLAMSEILVLGTRHQIVINEAVDLAKRFCDGAAPRIINGCLRTFMKELEQPGLPNDLEDKEKLVR
ncbi:N utilization substance B [Quillaja saponaria]|uniref:N utilization substance B n=1 Tax=Quillaja saponaria TaxID=32244 RepID=A0AAD7PHU8_QUISA|nr:N utilization substance B [Quillaja saponaria]